MKRRVDEVQFGARGGAQQHHRILATQNNPASTIYQLTPGVLKAGTTDGGNPGGGALGNQSPNVQYSTSKYLITTFFYTVIDINDNYIELHVNIDA